MFARIPGEGITLEMYIRNTQVNKKNKKNKEWFSALIKLCIGLLNMND